MSGPLGRHPSVAAKTGKKAATFRVTYHGFTPAARTAFQSAVNVWKTRVTSTVPITVDATFQPLGTGILGSGRPQLLLAQLHGEAAGRHLGTSTPSRTSDTGASWTRRRTSSRTSAAISRTGSSAPVGPHPAGKYDFKTVVLHELGHGLGFLGVGRVSGGAGYGSARLTGLPGRLRPLHRGRCRHEAATFANNSAALAQQLQSNNVWFDSAQVRNANGGKRARLYAPNPFQGGSSYSHLNEATYPAGNPHSLMTPQLAHRRGDPRSRGNHTGPVQEHRLVAASCGLIRWSSLADSVVELGLIRWSSLA